MGTEGGRLLAKKKKKHDGTIADNLEKTGGILRTKTMFNKKVLRSSWTTPSTPLLIACQRRGLLRNTRKHDSQESRAVLGRHTAP